MTTEQLISHIRVIPDFPIKGIMFQDVTTLFKDAECLQELSDRIYDLYRNKGITKVVGIESRGFVLGAILATRLGAGFVPARKPGKLPADKVVEVYSKEYGTDSVEIHTGAISEDDVVLVHDDLLATGGSLGAAYRLVEKFHPAKVYMNCIIDLTDCPRREVFPQDVEFSSIIAIKEHE